MSNPTFVSQIELARIFEVRPATVRDWERAGCPVEKKGDKAGQRNLYRPVDVMRWKEERRRSGEPQADSTEQAMENAKLRKALAEAESAEIDLARKRRQLAPLAVMAKQLGDALSSCRGRLLGIGAKVAPMLELATDAAARKEMIDAEVIEALNEITNPDFGLFREDQEDDQEDDPSEDDASSAADAE